MLNRMRKGGVGGSVGGRQGIKSLGTPSFWFTILPTTPTVQLLADQRSAPAVSRSFPCKSRRVEVRVASAPSALSTTAIRPSFIQSSAQIPQTHPSRAGSDSRAGGRRRKAAATQQSASD